MATTKVVSVSMDIEEIERAQALAKQLGLSFSQYMNQAAKRERLRRAGELYREAMAEATADPEDAKAVADALSAGKTSRARATKAAKATKAAARKVG
jgi:hypothetical protein